MTRDLAKDGLRRALEEERALQPEAIFVPHSKRLWTMRAVAHGAIFTGLRPRPCLARDHLMQKSCSSASSQATREDLEGRPFVGPAGSIVQFGTESGRKSSVLRVYVTNAVKHFKFVPRGQASGPGGPAPAKLRPAGFGSNRSANSFDPPLRLRLEQVLRVPLPARASQSARFEERLLSFPHGSECWITVHPSALLRMPDREKRREARALFVSDLKKIKHPRIKP